MWHWRMMRRSACALVCSVIGVLAACSSDDDAGSPRADGDASAGAAASAGAGGSSGESAGGTAGKPTTGGASGAGGAAGSPTGGSAGTAAGGSAGAGATAALDSGTDAGPALDCRAPIQQLTIPQDPCEGAAVGFCAYETRCAPFLLELATGADCEAFMRNYCTQYGALPGISPLDLPRSHECAERLINAPCGCTPNEICDDLSVTGTLSDGAPCVSDEQCASTICSGEHDQCGVCLTVAASGESCGSAPGGCGEYLYCDLDTNLCAREGFHGDPCGDQDECEQRLSCIDGRCVTPLGEGSPCDASSWCDTGNGLVCMNGECTRASLATIDDSGPVACGYVIRANDAGSTTDFVFCPPTHYCDLTGSSGFCLPRPGLGESCATDGSLNSPICLLGLFCDGGAGDASMGICTATYPICN